MSPLKAQGKELQQRWPVSWNHESWNLQCTLFNTADTDGLWYWCLRTSINRATYLSSGVWWWLEKWWSQASGQINYYYRYMALCPGLPGVSRYQQKHSPTHTYPDHQSSFVCFLHLLRPMASSLFNLHVWQSFCTISLQVFFALPLGLAPFTSYPIHFFTHMRIWLQPVLL